MSGLFNSNFSPARAVSPQIRTPASIPDDSQYLTELLAEHQKLGPFLQVLPICSRLLNQEILRVSGMLPGQGFGDFDRRQHRSPSPMASSNLHGGGYGGWNGMHHERLSNPPGMSMDWQGAPASPSSYTVKKIMRLEIPVDAYPNFNFVGRLLGPRGNSLKRVELSTGCRVYIRGKGSIKDPEKEEKLRGRPGYEHLNEPLHILIEADLAPNMVDMKLRQAKEILEELLKPVVKTVKVSNVSREASERELKEFFSFSGDIEYVETKSEDDETLTAYVTFKDPQGADTAVLLTGATIVGKTVTISLDHDYELPPAALAQISEGGNPPSGLRKAEDVVSGMLAKGFILGKDAVGKAKSFDEKHQLTSTASLKIASLDQKIGFTEKISMGTSAVNSKVKELDEKFQVSEKTKTAFSLAEEKVSNASSAVMKNRYVLTGTTWVTGAFSKVAKAAGEVGQKTKEKVGRAEDEQKQKVVDDYAQVHFSEPDSPKASSSPKISVVQSEQKSTKPEPAQGLIL